jgi:FtsP/CotA-like multicopper oxidase with cupredoxin domain
MTQMTKMTDPHLTRRDLLKIGAATGAATALGGLALAPGHAEAASGSGSGSGVCTGLQAIEAYPTSPLILEPFRDPLPVLKSSSPIPYSEVATWRRPVGYGPGEQDTYGASHQVYPGQTGGLCESYPQPLIYKYDLKVAPKSFSSSPVRTLVSYRDARGRLIPAGTVVPKLPDSTIYGFNGGFPGGMINVEYGKPVCVRFENHLDENPYNLDRGDFGAPDHAFLTHLHNGHTACESDGNPHHRIEAYPPGTYCDNLYLNYPAGGEESQKQAFLWFHDHREAHTGANVYKGMVGIFPMYDPVLDPGDESAGLRLPGVRVNKKGQPVGPTGYDEDGSFDVEYDIPLAFYDCALDDGVVPHQDFHNGCGEAHPEWWGKLFFRHFPNHGFVGDIFTTNCTAYPYLEVKRRKYRFRFLCASISRCYEWKLMSSRNGPKTALALGYAGPELQGQYRLPDGQQCMQFVQIGTSGLLPRPLIRDSFENWPAMRYDVVVDFTRYMDGTPTKKGDAIYLTNIMKMGDGRKPDTSTRLGLDKNYKVPVLKFIIGDDAPDNSDPGLSPHSFNPNKPLRAQMPVPANYLSLPRRTFELQRGGFGGEIQWLINGHPFEPTVPLADVKKDSAEVWVIRNGGGGWTHPMHIHQEEHMVLSRNGQPSPAPGHPDDIGKDDVIALDPGEEVWVYRKFRSFVGNYVAHCHNLAHEDHAMMFGWRIVP